MSTRLHEKLEKIQKVIEGLAEESAKGTLIVVEGKKDKEALRTLEILGPALTAKTGGKSFMETVQSIEQTNVRKVILLLDFDRRGKEGTSRLKHDLEIAKITPNLRFWRDLASLLKNDVHCVEGIPAYLRTLREKTADV